MGEISLIDDLPSTASVTAIEPTTIWYIARAGLLRVWNAKPDLAAVLIRDVASKLRATDELIASRVETVDEIEESVPISH